MKKLSLLVLPLLVVATAAAVAAAMVNLRKTVQKETPTPALRSVETITVRRGPQRFEVRAFGTVAPRTETNLVAEVTGRVIEVAPCFVTGGFFETGEVLLKIDDSIYQADVARSEAEQASAAAGLIRELAEAALAESEWQQYGEGEASDLVLRKPQLAEATARVKSAEAALARARINLLRTTIRAPYSGRIRDRLADEGQYLIGGTPIARVYATDIAEVRLPIAPADLAYLDLPLGNRVLGDDAAPEVEISSRIGAVTTLWKARIVRTEGEVDPRSRVVFAVAEVLAPYAPESGPPLMIGSFVEARVFGHELSDVAEIPRRALRGMNTVHIVDAEGRLRFRDVEILRRGHERVVIGNGIEAGDKICLTDLDLAIDGMLVNVIGSDQNGAD